MRRALVVEDDTDIVELLLHYLRRDQWSVDAVSDGREALERLRSSPYDLMLLDLQIPGLDGLKVCAQARAHSPTAELPIIMLTARGEETDRIVGLEMGADDYVVKPFSPKELMARIRAVLRRTEQSGERERRLSLGALEIDSARHLVRWDGATVHLTAKEQALLTALVEARGRVLSRQHLLDEIWGEGYSEGTRTIDVHIRRLREKLPGLAPSLLTVKNVGYRLMREGEQ